MKSLPQSLSRSLTSYCWLAVAVVAILLVACQPVHPEASPTVTQAETPQATAPAKEVAATAPDSTPAIVGTWTATVTSEDVLRVVPDFKREFLCDNTGTFVWQFKADGTFTIDQSVAEGCPTPEVTHIDSTWENEGNIVAFAKGTPDEENYAWSVDDDTLTFTYQSGNCIACKATNTANPWKRVEE